MNCVLTERDKNAIVAFAVGEEYKKNFNQTFRPSVEQYAENINTELIIVDQIIQPSKSKIYWQRFLMFSHPQISQYSRVLMVDSDVYITKHAKNIFNAVGKYPWGATKNNAYDLPELSKTDKLCFESCPKENRPNFLLNGGVYVISSSYKNDLERLYKEYSIKEHRGYDMGPLSYFLLNENKGIVLPPEFNTIVISYLQKYGCSLSVILKMYDSASFIHFAASKWRSVFLFIKWFDTTDSEIIKKIIRFFGKKSFDPFTSLAFKVAQRLVGIYNYRFRKYFYLLSL